MKTLDVRVTKEEGAFKRQNSGTSMKQDFPVLSHLGVSMGTICQLHINKGKVDSLCGQRSKINLFKIFIHTHLGKPHSNTVLIKKMTKTTEAGRKK